MKLACLIFANGIVLINVIAGVRQLYKLGMLKISACCGVITRSTAGNNEEWQGGCENLRMFSPQVEYAYEVAGQPMKGNSISLASVRTSNQSEAKKQLLRYPPGACVNVFFNVENPQQSYLINPKKHMWTTSI